jgi:hypothetical protein
LYLRVLREKLVHGGRWANLVALGSHFVLLRPLCWEVVQKMSRRSEGCDTFNVEKTGK